MTLSGASSSKEARLRSLLLSYEDAERKRGNPVPWLKTEELRSLLETAGGERRVILIDVREEPERRVSILRGALSPAQIEGLLNTPTTSENSAARNNLSTDTMLLVPYCTAGVRSAAYAKSLMAQYPQWAACVRNGEGIIRATYVIPEYIVDPVSGKPTSSVHAYGAKWDLAAPSFETVLFSQWERLARTLRPPSGRLHL